MGHRRASESRSEKNAKKRARRERGGRLGKTVGQKVGSVGRARNKDIRVRGRNSFLFQERLPRDRLSSASRRSEGKRGRGGEGSAPSRVPSIFPATRTGTNCDSTVATSSPSPSSFEERCCCCCCCRVCEEELENERN